MRRTAEVYGTLGREQLDARRLHGMIALGTERTIEQDPAFALRVMVDVAIRALSPAVNDPTTAVQVLDHLEDTLTLIGTTAGLTGRWEFRDATGGLGSSRRPAAGPTSSRSRPPRSASTAPPRSR